MHIIKQLAIIYNNDIYFSCLAYYYYYTELQRLNETCIFTGRTRLQVMVNSEHKSTRVEVCYGS